LAQRRDSQKAQFFETVSVIIGYVKQETLGAMRPLGRYLAFGVSGAVLVTFGFALILLGILRLLQSETGSTFHAHLSWVPYLVTMVIGVGMTIVSFSLARKRSNR
jgi:predicted cobalt transporter CbtA